jgi:hypothetical protein
VIEQVLGRQRDLSDSFIEGGKIVGGGFGEPGDFSDVLTGSGLYFFGWCRVRPLPKSFY